MRFQDLKQFEDFTMSGTSFDLGRIYRKVSPRRYQQVSDSGMRKGPIYTVGSINVSVERVAKAADSAEA